MRHYLGPHIGTGTQDDPWRAPDGCAAHQDLRSLPGHDQPGIGLFSTPGTLGRDWTLIAEGDIREAVPREALRKVWASAAGVASVSGDTVRDWLVDTVTLRADPSGETACRPVMPDARRRLLFSYGGVELLRRRLDLADPFGVKVRDRLRGDYRRVRAEHLSSGHYRKVLGWWKRRYGVEDEGLFIPGDLPRETAERPASTFGDTFVESSDTALGSHTPTGANAGSGWTTLSGAATVIASIDRAEAEVSGNHYHRMDDDLSGDDHYSEAVVNAVTGFGGQQRIGVMAMKDSSATVTMYFFDLKFDGADQSRLFKLVSGSSFTSLDSGSPTIADSTDYTLRLTCVGGASQACTLDGSSELSASDTALSGNLRCGLTAFFSVDGTLRWDDFVCADTGAAPAVSAAIYHHRTAVVPTFGA